MVYWEDMRYLEAQGTQQLLITGLITLLVTSLNALIGVTPNTSRVILPLISSYYVPCASKYGLNSLKGGIQGLGFGFIGFRV